MSVPVLALSGLCLLVVVLWPLGLGAVIESAASSAQAEPGAPSAVDSYLRLVFGRSP